MASKKRSCDQDRQDTITEEEFRAAIDCRFPYTEDARAAELIEIGCSLSVDAAFAIVHELARPGRGADAPSATRHRLLNQVDARLDHPSKTVVLPIARRMIDGKQIDLSEALQAMEQLAVFQGLWCALNIIYFSSDDPDGVIDSLYDRISEQWQND